MYDPTQVVVICAGDGTRWANHQGVAKHFAPVDGEPIVSRTVRLMSQFGCDVHIVARTDNYRMSGASLLIPELTPDSGDADKFLSSRELWNTNGRTVILYGDVFFTDTAAQTIMGWPHPDWRLFGRAFGSSFTGSGHGECFAISFYHDYIPEFAAALRRVVRMYTDGLLDRCGGWEVYKAMIRLPDAMFTSFPDPVIMCDRFTQIDDWTEDFDWPHDYDTFISRYESRSGN